MKGFRTAGTTFKLLVCAAVASGALTLGVASGFGATPSTPYRTVAVGSPDPVDTSQTGVRSNFGTRLSAGDMTGDGVQDIVVGSYAQDLPPEQVTGGTPGPGGAANNNAGRVALINGATQEVVWKVTPGAQASPSSDQGVGFFVSVPGDVNKDGREDVTVSAGYRDVGGNVDQGKAYVLSGPTGAVIHELDSPDPQANGLFGTRLGAAGDITGDKVGDIIVGAFAHDFPAGCGNVPASEIPPKCNKDQGQAYIFNGATGALVRELNLPRQDEVGCLSTTTGRCSFGGTVQSPGDVNGDGWPDHTVAAYAYGVQFTGRVYLFSGGGPTAGQVLARIDPPEPQPFGFFGLEDPDRFAPGDLNADGTNDLYFNSFGAAGGGHQGAGRAWTFDGKATLAAGTGKLLYPLTDPQPGPARSFGWANSKTDYNKDRRPDLFVSNLSNVTTSVFIFDGRNGSLLRELGKPLADFNEDPTGGIGWSSRAPGDLNRDCEPDYAAGAPYQNVGGRTDQGKVYFFLSDGGNTCPRTSPPKPAPPKPAPPANCPPGTSAGVSCQPIPGGGRRITGTADNDTIVGTNANDVIRCGDGDDVVSGGPGNDTINCGDGRDRISGNAGNDRLFGEAGNDRISGDSGNDSLSGGSGNDRGSGASGRDRLNGNRGDDILRGNSANDSISGSFGRDRISGNSGNDRLAGNAGNDRISGDSGRDRINGGSGRDRLSGASGNDSVSARDRTRDSVRCGRGRDRVTADRRRGRDRVSRECERVRRR